MLFSEANLLNCQLIKFPLILIFTFYFISAMLNSPKTGSGCYSPMPMDTSPQRLSSSPSQVIGQSVTDQDCTEVDVHTYHVTLTYKPRIWAESTAGILLDSMDNLGPNRLVFNVLPSHVPFLGPRVLQWTKRNESCKIIGLKSFIHTGVHANVLIVGFKCNYLEMISSFSQVYRGM